MKLFKCTFVAQIIKNEETLTGMVVQIGLIKAIRRGSK